MSACRSIRDVARRIGAGLCLMLGMGLCAHGASGEPGTSAAADTSAAPVTPHPAGAERHALERPRSHQAVLRESAREQAVVVALFSLPDCPWCEALRRDQLRHLAREQAAYRVHVVEYDLTDRTPFAPPAGGTPSPAALAAALQVRVAPTVVFLGPDGSELAERLVGYPSPDFYGAYLEQRLAQARKRLGTP